MVAPRLRRVARLPNPEYDSAERWVAEHLGDLALEGADGVRRSSRFPGGQTAADAALADYSVRGYAARRNQVLPESARGASGLSPYIPHGLLSLPRVWRHTEAGPARTGPSSTPSCSGRSTPATCTRGSGGRLLGRSVGRRSCAPAAPRTDGRTRAAAADRVPEAVWLTVESLGDADPALAAHPDRPAVFVFDEPLLARLRLSGLRLVFLADLAQRQTVEVHKGDPVTVLTGRPLAVTHTPVPGFAVRAAGLEVVARHPWPWLRRPACGSVASFTAWVRNHERKTR